MNRYLWLLFLGLTAALPTTWAQTDTLPYSYESSQKYEIGGIEVTGNDYTDPNGIISVSGLVQGNTVQIPGDDIAGLFANSGNKGFLWMCKWV